LDLLHHRVIKSYEIRFSKGGISVFYLCSAAQMKKKYGKMFGKDFDTTDANEVVNDILDYLESDDFRKKRSGHTAMWWTNNVMFVLYLQGRFCQSLVDFARKLYANAYSAVSRREKVTGEYLGPIAASHLDFRHVLHVLMANSLGDIGMLPQREMQEFFGLILSFNTSRRPLELFSIALQSFEFVKTLDEHGNCFDRRLRFDFVYAKGYGIGHYQQSIVENDVCFTEVHVIAHLLLLLEGRGLIRSAIDVFDGREELQLSVDQCETVEDLITVFNVASTRLRNACLKDMMGVHKTGGLGSAFCLDDVDVDDDDVSRSSQGTKVFYQFLCEERCKHGKQVLFVRHTRQGLPTSEPADYSQKQVVIQNIMDAAGYIRSRKATISTYSCRKGYVLDVVTGRVLGISDEGFWDCQMMNRKPVRFEVYRDHDRIRGTMPANLKSRTVPKRHAEFFADHTPVSSAFEKKVLFSGKVKPMLQEHLHVREFIRTYGGWSAPLFDAGPVTCPYRSCGRKFCLISDFLNHICTCALVNDDVWNAGDSDPGGVRGSCACGKLITGECRSKVCRSYCEHVRYSCPWMWGQKAMVERNIGSGRFKVRGGWFVMPDVVKTHRCKGCGRYFVRRNRLDTHLKESVVCFESKSYKPVTGNEKHFTHCLNAVMDYAAEHDGNGNVPYRYELGNGFFLGHWLYFQKRAARIYKETYPPERISLLIEAGVQMEGKVKFSRYDSPWNEELFEERLSFVRAYSKAHGGDGNVPQTFVVNGIKLGIWLKSQKRLMKVDGDEYPQSRIDALKDCGVTVDKDPRIGRKVNMSR